MTETETPKETTSQTASLSVVMPAYNEENLIAEAVLEVREKILGCCAVSEFIIVDDGSKDKTGEILDDLAAQDARIRVIHKPNAGHGPALRTGLDQATGDLILLLDSDRQVAVDSFPEFYNLARQYDVVLGVRAKRYDPPTRLLLTRAVRLSLFMILGIRLRDANCPFKLFRRSVWQAAEPLIPPDTLAPSLLFAAFVSQGKYRVVEREIVHRERPGGVSSIRHWKLLVFCSRAFRQLLEFRCKVG